MYTVPTTITSAVSDSTQNCNENSETLVVKKKRKKKCEFSTCCCGKLLCSVKKSRHRREKDTRNNDEKEGRVYMKGEKKLKGIADEREKDRNKKIKKAHIVHKRGFLQVIFFNVDFLA